MKPMFKTAITVLTIMIHQLQLQLNFKESCAGLKETMA